MVLQCANNPFQQYSILNITTRSESLDESKGEQKPVPQNLNSNDQIGSL